jgi:chromosome segregation ATPase
MKSARYFLLTTGLLLGLLVFATAPSRGAESGQPSAAEAKLRETLRNTLLALRNVENEKAVLQAAQAESDDKVKMLTDQVEKITKQLAADKDAADKAKTELDTQLAQRDKDIAKLKDDLATLFADDVKQKKTVNADEGQITKLQDQVNVLNRRVAEQQTKNAGMFKIANEILQRYEKFGLGDALSAREPFTGITRVKLQSLFEDYQDKIVDQKIKPLEASAADTKPAPNPADTSGKPKATPAKFADTKPKAS